jgi:hypothetical protein
MPLCRTLCFNYPNAEDEKRQYNSVRVPSSQYINVLSSFTGGAASLKRQSNTLRSNTSDRPGKEGVSVKYDSYNRYLNKKKAAAMAKRAVPVANVPPHNVVNNKSNKNGVGILSSKCVCNN